MKQRDRVWRRCRFQGAVVPQMMLSMHLWIIQQRRWRILTRRDLTQQFCISFEQGVDRLSHLTSNTTDHAGLAKIGLRSLVKGTFDFHQSLIEPGPFIVLQPDRLEDSQKEHVLHRPGSPRCQSRVIQGASRLSHDGCPTKIRFEGGRRGEIVDRTNGGNGGGCHDRSNPWKREQDLSFTCLLDTANNFIVQLLDMCLQQLKFFDQLGLFQHQTTKTGNLFDANALCCLPLQFHQFGRRYGTSTTSYLLEGGEACGSQSRRSWKPLPERKGNLPIGVFHHSDQFWEQFITNSRELVFPASALMNQFIAVTDQSSQLSCWLCWRDHTADQLPFVGDLHSQFQLIVELIRQGQGISFVGFEHPGRPTLHMHDVRRDVQFLQVLFECAVIMAGAFHQHKEVLQWSQAAYALNEQAEA